VFYRQVNVAEMGEKKLSGNSIT